ELGLVDAISTSDDVVMKLAKERTVIKVRYQLKKKFADKFAHGASLSFNAIFNKLAEKNQRLG
ncbi:MAG: protease SohB, partial [Shewanella sp.]|nr:protease SohB [Shewanella sp.]